jgi:hypothetical protein
MATPVWSVVNLEHKLPDGTVPPKGQVTTAHWTATLEDQGETAGAYGSVGFGDPEPDDYIPYDQLTEAEVLQWVFDALGSEQVTAINDSLANQIEQKLNPTSASGVPW